MIFWYLWSSSNWSIGASKEINMLRISYSFILFFQKLAVLSTSYICSQRTCHQYSGTHSLTVIIQSPPVKIRTRHVFLRGRGLLRRKPSFRTRNQTTKTQTLFRSNRTWVTVKTRIGKTEERKRPEQFFPEVKYFSWRAHSTWNVTCRVQRELVWRHHCSSQRPRLKSGSKTGGTSGKDSWQQS